MFVKRREKTVLLQSSEMFVEQADESQSLRRSEMEINNASRWLRDD